MTAPVIQETTTPLSHTISFVLPAGMPATEVPVPRNARVGTKEIPERTVAAHRFSDGWSDGWSEERFRWNGFSVGVVWLPSGGGGSV
ncbi:MULTISPECIES: heme-binding protein [Cryobacterium]|uniref:Uncharacterized protein n=1 Tax=Cryobacterium breve TaxID=1259258 RepID=A0ABY2JC20_9MICO|nr:MULTISPECIES: heme-binding protein [Cryobacterium]TFC91146.1 hypothetical protein E3T20_14040 [Cryobacterium sp. TmT3-12]TFD01159.1 hypothetical protein E3O65_02375 [Cryobacterium breve]